MPVPIEQCPACNGPIYLEDGVTGSCTCPEGQLRSLLARRRQPQGKTSSVVQPQGTLPDLEPEMFLSPSARREYEAARAAAPLPRGSLSGDMRRMSTGMPKEASSNTSDDWDIDLGNEPRTMTASVAPDLDLQTLWLTDEEREMLPPGGIEPDPMNIQFDTEMDFNAPGPRPSGSRGESTRFRVDRGAPTHEPFEGRVEPGWQGGPMREVGRTRGYTILTDAPREARREPMSRQAAVEATRQARSDNGRSDPTIGEKARAAQHAMLPTALERIKRGGFLDD